MSNFCPDTRGRRWSLIWARLFSRAVGREEHCTQICLACVGSAHCVGAALGLPPLTARVLSQATLLRLQAALQGNCAGRALCCRHFPGLSPQAQVLGTPQRHRLGWACVLCPSQVGAAQATRCWASTLSQVGGASYHLPLPSHSVSWVCNESAVSGVPCVSSGELISGCDPPGRCQPSRIPGRHG